jgi:hypothetical protein
MKGITTIAALAGAMCLCATVAAAGTPEAAAPTPTRIDSTTGRLVSDGVRFGLWEHASDGEFVSYDTRSREQRIPAAPSDCDAAGAGSGFALITCRDPFSGPFIVDFTNDSRVIKAARKNIRRGDKYERVGRYWLQGRACTDLLLTKCPQRIYLQWRTGQRRVFKGSIDLDRKAWTVVKQEKGLISRDGRDSLSSDSRGLFVKRDKGPVTKLSSCVSGCDQPQLAKGVVVWVEHQLVHGFNVGTNTRVSWTFPDAAPDARDGKLTVQLTRYKVLFAVAETLPDPTNKSLVVFVSGRP